MCHIKKYSHSRVGRLILLRHGESIWNATDSTRSISPRFSGWADIPMTRLGKLQSKEAGICLQQFGFRFNAIFTSVLYRSILTLNLVLKELKSQPTIPVLHSWRLNERHYGSLVGLEKKPLESIAAKYGVSKEEVLAWRRSWDKRPPEMSTEIAYSLSRSTTSCLDDASLDLSAHVDIEAEEDFIDGVNSDYVQTYPGYRHIAEEIFQRAPYSTLADSTLLRLSPEASSDISRYNPGNGELASWDELIPLSESLEDTAKRILPLWRRQVVPRILMGEDVLVVGK